MMIAIRPKIWARCQVRGVCDASGTMLLGDTLLLIGSNICATPGTPYEVVPGNCNGGSSQANPAADVWYAFEATGSSLYITLASTGSSLENPNLALYLLDTDCNNLLPVDCTVGMGGNAMLEGDLVLPGETYYLQISGSDVDDQCEFDLSINNNSPFVAPSPILTGTTSFCVGGNAFLEAAVGFDYLWSNGSTQQSILPDVADTYCLTITDVGGCSVDTCVLVTENTALTPNLGADVEACEGDAVILDAGLGFFADYEWSNAATDANISPTASGDYCVTVSDASGCTGSDCAFVSITLVPAAPLVTQPDIYCLDETVEDLSAFPQSGGVINWYDADGNLLTTSETLIPPVLPDVDTSISYFATEANGTCESEAMEIILSIIDCGCSPPAPPLALTASLDICAGDINTLSFEAQSDANTIIKWYDSQTATVAIDSGTTFVPTAVGVYYAETRNIPEDGCNSERIAFTLNELAIEAVINSSVAEPVVLENGEMLTLTASSLPDAGAGVSYAWSSQPPDVSLDCPSCPEITLTPENSTIYTLTATHDASGCAATATINVGVNVPVREIYALAPSAFSPNDDGVNDLFKVTGNGITSVSYLIYNRWGQKVYAAAATDLSMGWNGTYKGKTQEMGTYVYYIEVGFTDGTTEVIKGNVVLVR